MEINANCERRKTMKRLSFISLILVAQVTLFAQLKYHVSTDSSVYHYGDSIHVTITASNIRSVPDTLWLSDCDVEYIIDNFNLSGHRPCSLAITDYVVMPHDSITWNYLPPYPVNSSTLTIGRHAVVGEFYGYGLSDTLWVTVDQFTAVKEEENGPQDYALEDNYPDPFNPLTTIEYRLPVSSFVTLKIYDVLGREIATLVNERHNAGTYSVVFNAASLPSGVYFDQLEAGTFSKTKKILLLK